MRMGRELPWKKGRGAGKPSSPEEHRVQGAPGRLIGIGDRKGPWTGSWGRLGGTAGSLPSSKKYQKIGARGSSPEGSHTPNS